MNIQLGLYVVSFVAGSPFKSSVVDVGSLCVNWDAIRLRPVHCPVVVSLDAKGSPEADIACTVTGAFLSEPNSFQSCYKIIIIIIIIIISTTMFMVLSSWQSHCESSPGSFHECRMAPSGR